MPRLGARLSPQRQASLYYPGGPNTGPATSPSRFAYTGASALPGVDPINTAGDLYVATRTSSGWVSRYIGISGDQAGCMGGPPTDPRTEAVEDKRQITNTVLTNPSMSRFLDFVDGTAIACTATGRYFEDQDDPLVPPPPTRHSSGAPTAPSKGASRQASAIRHPRGPQMPLRNQSDRGQLHR